MDCGSYLWERYTAQWLFTFNNYFNSSKWVVVFQTSTTTKISLLATWLSFCVLFYVGFFILLLYTYILIQSLLKLDSVKEKSGYGGKSEKAHLILLISKKHGIFVELLDCHWKGLCQTPVKTEEKSCLFKWW